MVANAHVSHRTASRLRIKIPSRRNQMGYFSKVKDGLSKRGIFEEIRVNAQTASVLLVGNQIDLEDVAQFARVHDLFDLKPQSHEPASASRNLVQPFESFDRSLQTLTAGKMDVISLVFFALLGSGLYQIARGNISAPPWHTAFWYAFGLFTAHLAKRSI